MESSPTCLPGTQMTTEWGSPGCPPRLRARATASRRTPLSDSAAQEPQARGQGPAG